MVKWVAFLGSLHWREGRADLWVGGVSFVEMLILHELRAGERMVLEKAVLPYRRPRRPVPVSAVPFGPSIDIWRSCQYIGALMRSLCALPGGIGMFVACEIGANHCRLRHIGWEKCGHGLTSWPWETASEAFLNELLLLFRYPRRSAPALLGGALPLRYCAARPASKITTWRLPTESSVANLVTDGGEEVGCVQVVLGFTGLAGLAGVEKESDKAETPLDISWVVNLGHVCGCF